MQQTAAPLHEGGFSSAVRPSRAENTPGFRQRSTPRRADLHNGDFLPLNQQGVSAMWLIREDPIVYSLTKPTFWRSVYSLGTHSTSPNNAAPKNEGYLLDGM
ncbi:hypothetical protein FQN54_000221 [Arachnomyces sp. PD_36]|nr:hypothetical protein FQN54_000221 [Arachnomyces sp. PD_36]